MKPLQQRRISLLSVGVFYGALALIAIGLSQWIQGAPPLRVGDGETPIWLSGLLGAALGGVVVALSRLLSRRSNWANELDARFRDLLGGLTRTDAAVLAVSSAIAEELLFRGFLLPVGGLVVSSIVFGLMHIGPSRAFLPWTAFATALGFGFGALTLWTGDISAAVVAHLTINYFNFLAIAGTES